MAAYYPRMGHGIATRFASRKKTSSISTISDFHTIKIPISGPLRKVFSAGDWTGIVLEIETIFDGHPRNKMISERLSKGLSKSVFSRA
jgi:hypothetical protein